MSELVMGSKRQPSLAGGVVGDPAMDFAAREVSRKSRYGQISNLSSSHFFLFSKMKIQLPILWCCCGD